MPLTLKGAREPIPIVFEPPVPSAQLKSAVLLAGLSAPGETIIVETEATRDHTEKMLAHFGADLRVEPTAVSAAASGWSVSPSSCRSRLWFPLIPHLRRFPSSPL